MYLQKLSSFLYLAVVIELQEVGFMSGNDIVGTLRIPLREIMDRKCISGQRELYQDQDQGNGKAGKAKVEIRWVGNFD